MESHQRVVSEIRRYFTECGYGCSHSCYEDPQGEWVDYNDHRDLVSKLKSEIEHLKADRDDLKNEVVRRGEVILNDIHRIVEQRDEIENLKKAGDAMADLIKTLRCGRNGIGIDNAGGFRIWSEWKSISNKNTK